MAYQILAGNHPRITVLGTDFLNIYMCAPKAHSPSFLPKRGAGQAVQALVLLQQTQVGTQPRNHRTTEWLGSEGTSKIIQFQPSLRAGASVSFSSTCIGQFSSVHIVSHHVPGIHKLDLKYMPDPFAGISTVVLSSSGCDRAVCGHTGLGHVGQSSGIRRRRWWLIHSPGQPQTGDWAALQGSSMEYQLNLFSFSSAGNLFMRCTWKIWSAYSGGGRHAECPFPGAEVVRNTPWFPIKH